MFARVVVAGESRVRFVLVNSSFSLFCFYDEVVMYIVMYKVMYCDKVLFF